MATIQISNLSINKGGTTVKSFSDTFNRTSGNLGQNWIQSINPISPIANPITAATFSIGAATDLAQAMLCSNVGTTNPGSTWAAGLFCAALYMPAFGKSQFSEWLMINNNKVGANDATGGPAVMLSNSGQISQGSEQVGMFGYYLEIAASDKSFNLQRGNAVVATLQTSGGAASFANGDIIRLEAIIGSSSIVLNIKKNGSLLTTVTDNTVGRLTTGSPGWFGRFFDNTAGGSLTSQWRNFNGGLL
jgi:hypothetical protein